MARMGPPHLVHRHIRRTSLPSENFELPDTSRETERELVRRPGGSIETRSYSSVLSDIYITEASFGSKTALRSRSGNLSCVCEKANLISP
jgi:hypothetical protein